MLPSVCAARFFGCTAMPASSAHQTLCTLILPLARSTDTSATPAASVSSFTMVATPSAAAVALARPVRHLGDDAYQVLHARLAFRQLKPERDRILRQLLGDLVEEALGRERVVAVADAAPRREPRAAGLRSTCSASLFGIGYCAIGEPFITMRSTGGGLVPAIAAV